MAKVHERLCVQGRRARGFRILAEICPEVCFRLFPFLSVQEAFADLKVRRRSARRGPIADSGRL